MPTVGWLLSEVVPGNFIVSSHPCLSTFKLRHRSHGYVFVDPLTYSREKRLKEAKEPSAGDLI